MLAYMRLIIREAHRHGGNGWLTYDTVFRRNQQGDSKPWNVLDPSLHTAYIAGQGTPPLAPCKHCNETDHTPEECALAPLLPATKPPQREREWRLPAAPRLGKRPFPGPPTAPPSRRICLSWNRGACILLGPAHSGTSVHCAAARTIRPRTALWPGRTLPTNGPRGVVTPG